MEPSAHTASEGESRDHVGALLRRTREGKRMALPDVARALRIRIHYLDAIENGAYERLPAQVYAVGFIRAYADYLALDGEEAVRRFRRETQGLDSQPDLSFPVPIAERSIPGGRILVTALVLAVCGYGLWYYQAGGGRKPPDTVPQVPAALVQPSESGAADPLASPSEARASVRTRPQSAPTSLPAGQDPKVAAAPIAAATAPLPEPALRNATAPVAALPPNSVTAATAAPPPSQAAIPDVGAGANTPDATAEQVALLSPPPPPPKPSVPATGPGHVYGMTDEPVHIVVHITGDCWIEVREADQSLRFSKLLHAGDEYRVADLAGLTLKTGNSNGLKILVDGKQVNIPPVDSRVYSIALDPARLASGDAAVPAEIHPVTVPRHPD
ncbi:MAG TPA: RodZ domain-containing protein [Stellaceae bacterium]|nr:RodZ domain-containing protein [Stellaceae bacterium]